MVAALTLIGVSASSAAIKTSAATPAVVPAVATAGSLLSAILALALVLGLILGLAWLLRRMPGNAFNGSPGLRPIASMAVGAKERLIVVEVGGEQLLLGVTAAGISVLHKLPQPLPSNAAPINFSELLSKRLGRPEKAA